MGKRGFVLSAIVAACWLLVVGVMARAVSPERPPTASAAAEPPRRAVGHRPDDTKKLRFASAAAAA
ncbi:MAG TPA: hypothetical protein P5298_09630, partial [Spirochaetia bacterium]|nr:hypothetical protein [Spirochaetia bacterium]